MASPDVNLRTGMINAMALSSKVSALVNIPRGPNSQIFCVDPQSGSDSNAGTSFEKPLLTLKAAYDKCVTNQNDIILLVGGPTANALAEALVWTKAYTHLIGLSADLPGVGQRVRVTGSAALDLTYLIDFQGAGCIVKNVQFFNGADANADAGAVIVSGGRCYFENVFFAGMGHVTPAARAGSYSLKLTGDECTFKRCTIGMATILRAAANAELWMTGECNREKFIDCEFVSWSNTAGKFLIKLDSSAVPYTLQFENCLFNNFKSNNGAAGTSIDNAINDAATPYHQIILRGDNPLVGVVGYADVVTYVFGTQPVPNAGYGVAINPTT
jgi:hypothetical protein